MKIFYATFIIFGFAFTPKYLMASDEVKSTDVLDVTCTRLDGVLLSKEEGTQEQISQYAAYIGLPLLHKSIQLNLHSDSELIGFLNDGIRYFYYLDWAPKNLPNGQTVYRISVTQYEFYKHVELKDSETAIQQLSAATISRVQDVGTPIVFNFPKGGPLQCAVRVL